MILKVLLLILSLLLVLIVILNTNTIKNTLKKENTLIVAYCAENINWIQNESKNFNSIFIYTKCKKPIPTSIMYLNNVTITQIKNIGSCDYAFLTHIINEYNNLSGYITFGKGKNNKYKNKIVSRNSKYYNHHRHDDNFVLNSWNFTNNKNMSNKFVKSGLTFREWLIDCFGESLYNHLMTYTCMCYGGYFTVHTKNLKKFPKNMYERMRSYQQHRNEEVDHFIERVWGMLITCKPHTQFTYEYFERLPPPKVVYK